jgi:hypothetical protein
MLDTIQQLGEHSGHGVFMCNLRSLHAHYVNDKFASLFGLSVQEALQEPKKLMSFVCTEELRYLQQRHSELMTKGFFNDAEFCIQAGGKMKYLQCDASVVGESIVGFVKDISASKEHENYLLNHSMQADILLENAISAVGAGGRQVAPHPGPVMNDFLVEENIFSDHLSQRKTRFDVIAELNNALHKCEKRQLMKDFRLITGSRCLVVSADHVKVVQLIYELILGFTENKKAGEITEIMTEAHDDLFRIAFKNKTEAGSANTTAGIADGRLLIIRALVRMLGGQIIQPLAGDTASILVELPRE